MPSKKPQVKKKTLLITGASGFIGRNLCEKLTRYKIYSPTSKELNLLDKKSVDQFFRKNKINVVIHAALHVGPSKKEFSQDMLRKNLAIFFNLVDNKRFYGKMIFFGSGAEYNKANNIINVKEEDFGKSLPEDDYGMFKYAVSKYAEKADDIIDLRLFGIYGKYEDYTRRFISNTICQSIFDMPITVRQNVFFDYLFIDDLVRIVDYFINNNGRYKIYNVGRGKRVDLLYIAKIIKEITKNDKGIKILKSGFANEYTCNNKRLLSEIGNFKFTSMEESINILKEWYTKIKEKVDKKELIVKI